MIKLGQIEFGVCKELLISSLNSKVDRFQRKKLITKVTTHTSLENSANSSMKLRQEQTNLTRRMCQIAEEAGNKITSQLNEDED